MNCACGAPCDYYRPADPCEGQVTVQDPDAFCPRHHCAKHKAIAHTARIPLPDEPEYLQPWGQR